MFSLRLLTFGLFSPGVEHSDGLLPPLWELAGSSVLSLSSLERVLCKLSSQTSWRLETSLLGSGPGSLSVAPSLFWDVSSLSSCCGHSVLWFFPAVSPHVQRGSSHLAGPGRGCPLNPDPQLFPLPRVGPLWRPPGSGCSLVLLDSCLCVQKLQLLPV